MTRALAGKSPAAVRAQLGRFGFSGHKATNQVAKLSGGERARRPRRANVRNVGCLDEEMSNAGGDYCP